MKPFVKKQSIAHQIVFLLIAINLSCTYAQSAQAVDFVDYVDPWIESNKSRFFFFASACRPFGMMNLSPDSRPKGTWKSGYHHADSEIPGFSHVHAWMLSGITVMPTSGTVKPTEGVDGWKSGKDTSKETVQPGYHKLRLDKYAIGVELTSTDRVGFYRLTHEKPGTSKVLFNLSGHLGQSNMRDAYINNGYDSGIGGAGTTLEFSFQDWCLAQMAAKLGRKAEYAEFITRSGNWKNLFHPEHKLIFSKDKDGKWRHTNPLSGRHFVEANSSQATWSVSHDLAGLADLMGGRAAFCATLNTAFEQAVDQNFVSGYGKGTVSYANQPGCSNAHVFNYAGKPWLSQYWVRQVNEKAYGGVTPELGYGGHDEDQGQMGGVSVLMSMGLFSVKGTCSQDPVYEITSPVFDSVTIHLDKRYYPGKTFKITTTNNSRESMYIQSARLNGKAHNRMWFYHREFTAGAHLELTLGPKPNTAWGVDTDDTAGAN